MHPTSIPVPDHSRMSLSSVSRTDCERAEPTEAMANDSRLQDFDPRPGRNAVASVLDPPASMLYQLRKAGRLIRTG